MLAKANSNFKFPALLKEAVKGLDHETRWRILEAIVNNGEISYSKLKSQVKIENKGLLNFHLTTLSKAALIERFDDLKKLTGDRSYYNISPVGRDVVNGLLSALAPKKFSPIPVPNWPGSAIGSEKVINYPIPMMEAIVDEESIMVSSQGSMVKASAI